MKTLLLISILFAIGASAFANNNSTGNGRFQLIQLSSMRQDQFMIDTRTGKIWQRTCLGNDGQCALEAWQLMEIEGITHSEKSILDEAQFLSKKAKLGKSANP